MSSVPSSLPQRLKEPPSYTSVSPSRLSEIPTAPPPYVAPANGSSSTDEKSGLAESEKPPNYTLHFLNHEHDSIASLSLRYGVPASALRRANNVHSDHLLLGRKTILIPGEFYKRGVSLSPQPIDGEEEELRKAKIRRFMTSCKIYDYDVAVLYLEQHGYDLDTATTAISVTRSGRGPIQTQGRSRKTDPNGSLGVVVSSGVVDESRECRKGERTKRGMKPCACQCMNPGLRYHFRTPKAVRFVL